jgi:hypothetical protein
MWRKGGIGYRGIRGVCCDFWGKWRRGVDKNRGKEVGMGMEGWRGD